MPKTLLLGGQTKITPENMADAMQQAIDIEIATIPVYLFTYYSINRTPQQDDIKAELQKLLEAGGTPPDQAETEAQALSAEIMVFANKAGALIVSVVIEEMLHMALSSNVKQAICGMPRLLNRAPTHWPAELPGHVPEFEINLAKLSQEQIYTFLQIESPKELPTGEDASLRAIPYVTIGEFYGLLEDAIKTYYNLPKHYNRDAAQLVPGRGYYAQNNINTNFYDKKHQQHFVNAEDSGDLVHVVNMNSALGALEEIVTQGEGAGGRTLNPDGTVNCSVLMEPGDFDDKTHKELAHFDKYNELYCALGALEERFRTALGDETYDVKSLFVYNFADNPTTSDYPAGLQDLSNLTNAVYSYLFVMTQACYRESGNVQFEVFMMGIHKSMMWILGSLCETIRTTQYTGTDGTVYDTAPTFEDWSFCSKSSPKEQIVVLCAKAAASNPTINFTNQTSRINSLPDVPIVPYPDAAPYKPILA